MTRVTLGPVRQRAVYGWLAAVCIPFGIYALWSGLASTVAFASSVGVLTLFLSFLALWQTTRVEVKADPDIVDPKAPDNSSVEPSSDPSSRR